ncbi:MAG TPA: SDR family oxidoreductase [Acidobacteriota bacterium]|nr:SDR family oxidoreductase [Acidobacteriota bacterium]
MKDKVAIVTGSTSGIGKETATALAQLGARVVMVARNQELAKKVKDEIVKTTGNQNVDILITDLSSQAAIRKAAAEFKSKYSNLHILINNAGMAGPRKLSPDGIEMTLAVNHLAYFLFTSLLLDVLKASAPARIINVSSEAHRNVQLDFDDLQMEKNYGSFRAYSLSKLLNILFTYELARRLEGSNVTVNALHPGFLSTGIFREAPGFVRFLVRLVAGSPRRGADAIIRLATVPEMQNISGKYFNGKKETPSSPISYDRAAAERLWKISTDLTAKSA